MSRFGCRVDDGEEREEVRPGNPDLARKVFQRGDDDLKSRGLKKERAMLLEVWELFESTHGTAEDLKKVRLMKPTDGARRVVDDAAYVPDLVFPDDEREINPAYFKFLQMARAWKESQERESIGDPLSVQMDDGTA